MECLTNTIGMITVNGIKWGEVEIDLSNYPTRDQMEKALEINSTNDKKYTDMKIEENITKVLGGEY